MGPRGAAGRRRHQAATPLPLDVDHPRLVERQQVGHCNTEGERSGSAQDEAPPDGPAASGQRLPLTQPGPASAARWVEQPEKLR